MSLRGRILTTEDTEFRRHSFVFVRFQSEMFAICYRPAYGSRVVVKKSFHCLRLEIRDFHVILQQIFLHKKNKNDHEKNYYYDYSPAVTGSGM